MRKEPRSGIASIPRTSHQMTLVGLGNDSVLPDIDISVADSKGTWMIALRLPKGENDTSDKFKEIYIFGDGTVMEKVF